MGTEEVASPVHTDAVSRCSGDAGASGPGDDARVSPPRGDSGASQPSAREWLECLDAGELSSRELVERTLARIDAADAVLNAVAQRRDEQALAAAEAADRARAGGDRRPLLGLPLTIKDCLDVESWRTAAGSLAREHHTARTDATVVARLRAAGAIFVAKTNVPECCASFETDNVLCGRTNNPLDPTRTPGGSSGGEAALLGADASIAGIGSDGGGSIRVPSHYCGLVGIRPTVGRTPETGSWPSTRASGTMDFTCLGPLARRVEDLELLLRIIAGADGIDPYVVDRPFARCDPAALDGLRVGFYVEHPRVPKTTEATRAAVRLAASALERAGAHVEEIAPPDAGAEVDGRSATEIFFEAAGEDGGAAMRRAVAGANGRHHRQFLALLGQEPEAPPSAEAFFATQRRCFAYRAHVRAAFERHPLILSPVVAGPAPLHEQPPAGIAPEQYLRYEAFEYVHVNAVAGVPAASVPVDCEEGLPLGVQVAAAPFREDRVFAALTALEQAFGGFAINRRLAAERAQAQADSRAAAGSDAQASAGETTDALTATRAQAATGADPAAN